MPLGENFGSRMGRFKTALGVGAEQGSLLPVKANSALAGSKMVLEANREESGHNPGTLTRV